MITKTQINGASQLLAGSVPWSVMNSGTIVPLASIIGGSSIILNTGTVAMGANWSMGGFVIQNHAAPVNATDVVNKLYVDTKVSGFEIFGAAAVSVTNIATLSGLPTVDSYTMTAGQVVLLTNQTTTPAQKGPWVVSASAWTRPAWWATGSVVPTGAYFLIDPYGTTYGNTKWWMTTTGTITVDTTTVTFAQDSSGVTYTAGAGGGLTLTGSAFSVNTGNGITLSSGNVTAVGTGIISVVSGGISVANSSSAGQVVLGNASSVPTWTSISGDATLSGTGVATLATVNSNTGAFGSSTAIPTFTVNGKGLITAASTAVVVAPAGTLSGTALASGVVSSNLTSLGTLGSLSVSGTSTLSGVVTMSVAPILTGLTGFVYANGSSAVSVSTTIPSTALVLSANEIPTGALNGSNTAYTLAHSPAVSSLELAMNGVTLRPGASYDYTVSGTTVTMNYAPASTDYLSAYYFY